MDCKTAHLLLDFTRPSSTELDADERAALEHHLSACVDCARAALEQRRLDEHLGAAMRDVSLPDGLRERLGRRLESERLLRRRRRLHFGGFVAAAAAAVLLAIVFGLGWLRTHPPGVDLDQIRIDVAGETSNPSRESVDDWLSLQRPGLRAPADFNYRLLSHYYLADFQGQRVPLLLFTRNRDNGPAEQVRVYILSANQFDLKALEGVLPTRDSGCNIDVRFDPDHPRSTYLIIHTGESLEPFLQREERTAT